MASELKKLFDPVQLTTSAARLGSYSVPAGKRLDGFELILSNINSAERGVDIYLGASASAATQLYSKRENGLRIAGETPLVVPSRQVLAAGDGIWAAASDPSSISVHASGVEIDEEGALPTRLFPSRVLSTVSTTLYTVGADKQCFNFELTLLNVLAEAATFTSYLVPAGSNSDDPNRLSYGLEIAPNETKTFSLRQVMEAGDKIVARSNRANALTIHGSGYVEDSQS